MTDRSKGIALALAAASISGVSVYLNSFAVRAFGDATVYTTVKNLIAAVILIAVAGALATRGPRIALSWPRSLRQRIALVAIGVIGGGIPFVLFFQGLAQTSSTSAAFVQKTLVVWVAVLAVAILRERFSVWHAGAIALLVGGQAIVGGVGAFALDSGEVMVLTATLLWSVEVVIAKPLLASLSPLTVASARMGIGVLVLAAIVVATGLGGKLAGVTPEGWLWVGVTGVILSAYVGTWYAALARATAIDVTAVLVFGAVVTALISSGVRGTSLVQSAPGLALITVGTFLVVWLARRRTVPAGGGVA